MQWDRERGFVRPRSRFPVADLYLCWDRDALYLGLYAMDPVEVAFYRDGQILEADRMEWRFRLGRSGEPIRVRLGPSREPTATDSEVRVSSVSGSGQHPWHVAVLKVPAGLLGRVELGEGDRFSFASTLLTHARAGRVEWGGVFQLAR